MADYRFVTNWLVDAPIEEVWDAVFHSERWPRWWKGVESVVELEPGAAESSVGSLRRYVWKSKLPYRLEFEMRTTRVEPPEVLEGKAVGELEGDGRWRLCHNGQGTLATYVWEVRTTRPWMDLLAPLARPVFAWNHDVVMRQGGQGLAKLLGTRVWVPIDE